MDKQGDSHSAALDPDLFGFNTDETVNILVIYTGGTVGMKEDANGCLAPRKGYLPKQLAKRSLFHDPLCAPLTTKLSEFGKRVHYKIKEYDPLLDSSQMTMDDWLKIAKDVQLYYNDFSGFVILHGTDTMAYTASALSFLFKNLTKPVVLTGSQLSISRNLSDGSDNIYGALMIAAHFNIPEVVIYFNHKLMRGNRTKKVNTEGFAAFDSFNYPALVDVGSNWDVHWQYIRNPPRWKPYAFYQFSVHPKIEPNVVICTLYPGITAHLIRNILAPPVVGCVLSTFGAGNAPLTEEFLQPFKEAISRGVVILNVTQCVYGSVYPSYTTGKALEDIGIIPAFDMTPEAAIAKLSCVSASTTPFLFLQAKEWKIAKMKCSSRGELTDRTKRENTYSQSKILTQLATALKNAGQDMSEFADLVPIVLCLAAGQGSISEIKELTRLGFHVNLKDYDGRTACHLAAAQGKLETLTYLHSSGADLGAKDRWGRTPLDEAIIGNHDSCIQFLKSKSNPRSTLASSRSLQNSGSQTAIKPD